MIQADRLADPFYTFVLVDYADAIVYSSAEYCCAVWDESRHTTLIDAQLNETMCTISGVIKLTPISWLPVLANIHPVLEEEQLNLRSDLRFSTVT